MPVAERSWAEPRKVARSEVQHFLLEGVDWLTYEKLLEALDERHIRLTYDRGNLELMTLSSEHEIYGVVLGYLLALLSLELRIPIKGCGSFTLRRQDVNRGLEPDKCFYVQNVAHILKKKRIDLRRDPAPDLAIEIDVTHSSLDRMAIYAALKVREVWRFDGRSLRAYVLGTQGKYRPSKRSLAFPFLPLADLVPFLRRSTEVDDTELARLFLDWVRGQIMPAYENWAKSQGR